MKRKTVVSFVQSLELANRPDAHLLLTKPITRGMCFDVEVISFASRTALESFNKKANLNAVVKTPVHKGCALYKHQIEAPLVPPVSNSLSPSRCDACGWEPDSDDALHSCVI